ncbi:MAG: lactate utilization protein [Candidatus Binatia bacterium]
MDPAATLASLETMVLEIKERAGQLASDLFARFVEAAQKVGCQTFEAKDSEEAGRFIADFARSKNARVVQTSSADLLEHLDLAAALQGSGVAVSGPDPEGLLSADIGISEAVAGIAETGSLLIHLDEIDSRLTTMLPPIHVALLKYGDVVESMEEGLLITRHCILSLQVQGRPSYISWVTGPSRTADIERVLTIGVHGPRELCIIIVSS